MEQPPSHLVDCFTRLRHERETSQPDVRKLYLNFAAHAQENEAMHVTTSQTRDNRQDARIDSTTRQYENHNINNDNRTPRQSKLQLRHLLANMDPDTARTLWDSLQVKLLHQYASLFSKRCGSRVQRKENEQTKLN